MKLETRNLKRFSVLSRVLLFQPMASIALDVMHLHMHDCPSKQSSVASVAITRLPERQAEAFI